MNNNLTKEMGRGWSNNKNYQEYQTFHDDQQKKYDHKFDATFEISVQEIYIPKKTFKSWNDKITMKEETKTKGILKKYLLSKENKVSMFQAWVVEVSPSGYTRLVEKIENFQEKTYVNKAKLFYFTHDKKVMLETNWKLDWIRDNGKYKFQWVNQSPVLTQLNLISSNEEGFEYAKVD